MSLADRAERLKDMQPHLHADIMLYATEEGGRKSPVPPGLSFICIVPEIAPRQGYDAWPQLGDEALAPGQQRRVEMVFLTPEGAEAIQHGKKFLLWEGRSIGEGSVVI